MLFFDSYKEAHEDLKIKGSYQRGTIGNPIDGVTSLKITENPKSFDRISKDLRHIWYVGKGKKSSQGEPAVNQIVEDQALFFKSLETQKDFPVLMKLHGDFVVYLGQYKVTKIEKKTKNKVHYFQIELQQTN